MGLDVYLYKAENLEKYKENEDKIHKIEEELWEQSIKINEDKFYNTPYFTLRRAVAEKGIGLFTTEYYNLLNAFSKEEKEEHDKVGNEIYSTHQSLCDAHEELNRLKNENVEEYAMTGVEHDSSKYPDHYFKVGYFRSSYNNAGINSVARKLGLPSLYDLFDESGDDYHIKVNWVNSLAKVQAAIEEWRKKAQKVGNYKVIAVDPSMIKMAEEYDKTFKVPTNEGQALELFLDHLEKRGSNDSFNSYSSREGHFFLNSSVKLRLKALINGYQESWKGSIPGIYAICEVEDENGEKEDQLDWYIQALEIVQETIAYVLAQPDPDKYILAWSS